MSLSREPRQFGTEAPSAWENELADTIEAAFAAGIHDLAGVVGALNAARVRPPDGAAWTAESFTTLMRRLGG
jgi:hypothetical protein